MAAGSNITDSGTQNIYNLTAKTLFQLSDTVATNCLQVMPLEPKRKLQKFCVGSQKFVEIWECKKGMQNVFKSE